MINFSALRPETLIGRIVRMPFRLIPGELALPVLQGPLRGKKWIVGSHLHGCWLGSYELDMQNRIAQELRPGTVFYDVGANAGFYSLLAAALVAPEMVYAFEPLPANAAYLRRHLELNRIQNVKLFELAICDQTGTAFFSTEKTRAMGKLEHVGNLSVRTATLDALLQQQRLAPPDFIKMDIEGAEYLALLGAKECFAQHRPKLFLATHGREVHDDCARLLSSWNYELEYTSRPFEDRAELFAWPKQGRSNHGVLSF